MLAFTAAILSSLALAHPPASTAPRSPLDPATPRYILDLSLEEFSVLHSAADHGVRSYGGHAEFKIDIFPGTQGPVWQIIIDEPKLLPVWSQWMAEKTTQLVSLVDIDKATEAEKSAYRITRAVNEKLKAAADKPDFVPVRLDGTGIKLPDGMLGFRVAPGGETLRIVGKSLDGAPAAIAAAAGKPMIVEGVIKKVGEIELSAAFESKPGSLEVFVLSQCPYGKSAEKAIIERLRERAAAQTKTGGSAEAVPQVDFRYIFIPIDKSNPPAFTALHGESEVVENLVQMVIRDQFDRAFFDYLLKRAGSDAPWEEVAASVGLDEVAIATIEANITQRRTELATAEYAYMRARNVPLASPTYLLDGRIVKDVQAVPLLKGINLQPGQCGG